MRYVVLASALLSMFALAPAVAQDQPQNPPPDQPQGRQARREQIQQRLAEMADRLKLTPDQKQRIEPILRDEMSKVRDIRAKYQGQQGNRRAMMQEMRAVQGDVDKQLGGILTADQMTELRKMRQENRDRMRENMRERRQQQQPQQ